MSKGIPEAQVDWKLRLFKPNYDEREVEAVAEVIRGGWLTMGERTQELESRFSTLLGEGTQAVAVSSGTAALHMALLALGIGQGDEVIVSSLTFIAGVNVVRMVGARPILADCRSFDDWNLDPADVRRKLTPRTKAVIAVHYAGYPCDMDALAEVCDTARIALIEDSAHAIDARWRGRACGTFGTIGCFSFFANKNLAISEGGMLVTRDSEVARIAVLLRSHGMTSPSFDRHNGRAISYDVAMAGLNYRIDEMRAAMALVQLDRLQEANRRRGEIVTRYRSRLAGVAGLSVPFLALPAHSKPCWHIFPVLLDRGVDRTRLIGRLRERGIQSSVHYPAIQRFSAYANEDLGSTPIANEISDRELTLPLYPAMTDDDVDLVAESLGHQVS